MKKFNLSLVAVLAMGTFAVAGGDIEPVVEPVIEEVAAPVADDSGFYVGLAYSFIDTEVVWDYGGEDGYDGLEADYDAWMLQAGYKINSYLAIEARYWDAIGDPDYTYTEYNADGSVYATYDRPTYTDEDYDIDAWGIYVKPMYPVTNSFDIYALVGYADADITPPTGWEGTVNDKNGFSWGIGASYAFTGNLSVFADYVSLYDDDALNENEVGEDMTIDTWNFGVTYKF